MTIAKLIHKDVNQPLPRCRLVFSIFNQSQMMLSHKFSTNSTLRILTETNLQASNISTLLLQQSLDNVRSSIVNKSLTCWPDHPIKKIAELPLNKISNILMMNHNIVFENLGKNHTNSTFVLETPCETLTEISIN